MKNKKKNNSVKLRKINKYEVKKRIISCLLVVLMTIEGMFSSVGSNITFADDTANTQNIIRISGTVKFDDAGYESKRPEDISKMKFCVKLGDVEISSSNITVKNVNLNGGVISYEVDIKNYTQGVNGYSITASMNDVDSYYKYTSTTAGLAGTPSASSDGNIFEVNANEIKIKPDVTPAKDEIFTIKWWDGNNAGNERPTITTDEEKEAFLAKCKLQYKIDGNDEWLDFDDKIIEDNKLIVTSSIDDNWKITYKGVAATIGGKDVYYKIITPEYTHYIYSDDGNNVVKYDYCEDITGTITWNNYAVTSDTSVTNPNAQDININVSYVRENGEYKPIDDNSEVTADKDKNTTLGVIINKIETNIETGNTNISGNKAWNYKISNLPSYDKNGNHITYVVTETIKESVQDTYKIEYDNKEVSTATNACYNGGEIKNTITKEKELSFGVCWVEPENAEVNRPAVTYTLWRYAKDKKLPNSMETYDYSTAAMVTYVDNTGKHIISESHDFSKDDTWNNVNSNYTISFPTDTDSYTLPKYDEEGYEYVYFIKQTDDNMSTTDIDRYDEYFTDKDGTANPSDEKIAYEGGTIKNVYQKEIEVELNKQWNNIKNPEDLNGATVIITVTRKDGEGNEDKTFKETKTFTDFSAQLNSKSETVTLKEFDENCKKYEYIISESIIKGDITTDVTYTKDGITDTYIADYTYNSHPYKSTYTKVENTDGTWTYKIVNEEISKTAIKIKKVWGEGYNNQKVSDLPSIKVYLKQNGKEYATVAITGPSNETEKGSATITYQNGGVINGVTVDISQDGYTWTLFGEDLEVPQFDENNQEYVYTITEETVTLVPDGKNWGYTTSYNRDVEDNGDIILTQQITNYCYNPGEYNYKDCWAYKNWQDDGDTSSRSAFDIHVVIKDVDGNIKYDLSKSEGTDGKEAFIAAVKSGYGNSKTEDELEKIESIINGGQYSLTLSSGNDWKTKIIIPKEISEYAIKAAGEKATYSMIEAYMYSVNGGTELFPATITDGVTYINNEKQKYKVTVAQDGDKFTFTNTRVGLIDVSAEFKWNDFKNFPEVRPDEIYVELYRYTDNGTPNKVSDKTATVDVKLVNGSDGTYKCLFENQEEYDDNGKLYHYILNLSYKKNNVLQNMNQYEISSSVKYTQGSYSEQAINSKLEYKYEYDLSDDVTTRDVSFYKIWRDKEIDNNNLRPDLALKLHKTTNYADKDGVVNATETTTPDYCGAVNVKSSVLADNAYRYTFCAMPEYSVIRDENGKVVKVEKYTYSATEIINSTSINYYQYVYAPTVSVMDITDTTDTTDTTNTPFTTYAGISDWGIYADSKYAESYKADKSDSNYAQEGGCFVNGIEETLTYKGTKSWVNIPVGLDKDDYPYVEVYFFQSIAGSTESSLNVDGLSVSDLRSKAYAYTKLSVDKGGFYEDVKVPKYSEKGELYNYTIVEGIYKGDVSIAEGEDFPAADSLKFLPGFIMSKKSSGQGTNIFLTNEFDTTQNIRTLTINKSWYKDSEIDTANTVAKFNIYRIEKKSNADDITTVKELNERIKDGSAQLQQTEYLKNENGNATVENLPLYSPKGYEYIYVAVEDTSYAPSYNCVAPNSPASETSDKPYVVLIGDDNNPDYRYIKFASVASYDETSNPTNPTDKTVQAASYKNIKNTDKAVLEGTVKWVDYNNQFDTRPEEKMVYLTVKRAASQQSDGQHNANNADAKTTIFKGTDAEWVSGTKNDTTMVFKVPSNKNILGKDIYIVWTKDDSNNKWTYKIAGLNGAEYNEPIFDIYSDNGMQWNYYVTEEKTEGSDYQYFANNYTGYDLEKGSTASVATGVTDKKYTFYDITNTLSSKVTIQKQWKDSINQYKFRPASIKIKFQYRLTTDTTLDWNNYNVASSSDFVIDSSTNWKKVFDQLPKTDKDGNIYEFRVVETSISVNVDDSGTATEIGVKYYKENSTTELEKVDGTTRTTLSGKTESIDDVTYYLGKAGSYTAKVPTTISPDSTGSIFIYNTLESDDVVSLKISKTWSGDDVYKTTTRPEKIYVKIQKALVEDTVVVTEEYLAGDSVTWQDVKLTDGKSPLVLDLTSDNANADDTSVWEKKYEQLPKYDTATGKICYYRAVESDKDGNVIDKIGSYDVTNAYSYNANETTYPYSTNITNTYHKGSLTVSKVWDDDNNRDGKRPENVTVDIMYHDYANDKNGTESWKTFTTVTLGKDADGDGYTWSKTLENLPYYYISENIPSKNTGDLRYMQYKVVERAVDNYSAKYSTDNAEATEAAQSFVYTKDKTSATTAITNTYSPEKGNLKLVKSWSGDDNGGRPSSIDVRLYRTYKVNENSTETIYYEYYDGSATMPSWNAVGTKLEKTNTKDYITKLEGTTNPAWTKSLADLPLNTNTTATAASDNNYTAGKSYEYTYYLEEITNLGGYTSGGDVSVKLENNYEKTLKLTNSMKPLNINVNFNWDDLNNLYNIRDNYEVVVQRKVSNSNWTDVTSKKAEVKYDTEATKNGSTYSFTNLPQYSEGNVLYDYRVVLRHKDNDVFAGNTTTTTEVDLTGEITLTAPVQDGSYQITSTGVETESVTDGTRTLTFNAKAQLPVINVVGDVTWEDKFNDTDNYFGVRPEANTVDDTVANAYKIAIDAKDSTINGYITALNKTNASCNKTDISNKYTYKFTQLLKYNAAGNPISYSTSEIVDKSYTASSTEPDNSDVKGSATTDNKYTVNNHTVSTNGNIHTMTEIKNVLNVNSLTIKKEVKGADSSEEFQFNLYYRVNSTSDWKKYNNVTYKLKHNESVTIENLLQNVEYKIEEIEVQDYDVTAFCELDDISNQLMVVMEENNSNNTKSAAIELALEADKIVKVTNTGKATADIVVTKKWEDETYTSISERPNEIYFIFQRTIKGGDRGDVWVTVMTESNGNVARVWKMNEKNVTDNLNKSYNIIQSSDGNQWECTINDLPVFIKEESVNHNKFVYRVIETDKDGNILQSVANYDIKYTFDPDVYESHDLNNNSANSIMINTYVKKDLNVSFVWDDDNNRDGVRPDEVKYNLSYYDKDGNLKSYMVKDEHNVDVPYEFSIVPSENNSWSATITDLPVYDVNGKKIKYVITETTPDKYTNSSTLYNGEDTGSIELTTDTSVVKITNKYIPDTKSLTIKKYWNGDNNVADISRPDAINVVVYRTYIDADGKTCKEYLANAGSWESDYGKARRVSLSKNMKVENAGNEDVTVWSYTLDGQTNNMFINAYTKNAHTNDANTVPYTYWVEEAEFNGYKVVEKDGAEKSCIKLDIVGDAIVGLVNELDTIDVKVQISWNDYNNKLNTRKDIVLVLQSYTDGKWMNVVKPGTNEIWTENADENWKAEYNTLPTHDKNGNKIYYRVVIGSFDSKTEEIKIVDVTAEDGILGNAQEGKITAYNVNSATNFNADGKPYYLTKIDCEFKYQLAIENITDNPAEEKTNAGGKVTVMDSIDVSDFNVDDMPEPDETDKTNYETAKVGVVWEPDKYWTSNDKVIINYVDADGNAHELEVSIADMLKNKISDEIKAVFPDIKLYSKNDRYALILANDVLTLPEKLDVKVAFEPVYAIVNVTENAEGGTVQNVNGVPNDYSDGLFDVDGHSEYTLSEVLANARENYAVDTDKIYIAWQGNYGSLAEDKYLVKLDENGEFTTEIEVVLAETLQKVLIHGKVNMIMDVYGNVTFVKITSDSKVPLVFGVYFKTAYSDSKMSVKTGDNAPILWLLVLMFVSGGTIFTMSVVNKDKRKNKKVNKVNK